jgi:head-tail adaptor
MSGPEIGALRHRLTIEAPVDHADGAGGFRRSYQPVALVWAAVQADAGVSQDRDATGIRRSQRVIMRWRDDLTSAHRLRLGTSILIIRSTSDPTGERRFLVVQTEEFRP